MDTRNQTKAMCFCYSAALDFEKAVIGCMTDGVQCEYSLPARQKEHHEPDERMVRYVSGARLFLRKISLTWRSCRSIEEDG